MKYMRKYDEVDAKIVELLGKITVAITNKENERIILLCGWVQALMWVCRADDNGETKGL